MLGASHVVGEAVRSVSEANGGFASVDALVALTILAVVITLGFQAMTTSRRAAFAAAETGQARTLLESLLRRVARVGSDEAGGVSGFNWRTHTVYLPSAPGAPGITLCRRWAGVTAARSGRQYVLSTADFCRRPKAAA